MPISIESEVQSRIASFTAEIVAIVRASALEVVQEALGESVTPRAARSARVSAAPTASAARGKGAKRDPKAIEALTNQLGAFIKKTPGQRIEQIGKSLGIPTKELALPVKKLLAAKKISTKGQRRATTYFGR